jgi:hypothetical protein
VFVGDFPTGSINAEARKTPNGYLVLVNTGLVFYLAQIIRSLNMEQVAEADRIESIAQATAAYIRHGSPAAGPQPHAGGAGMFVAHLLSRACGDFVVAHEFGHLLAGHLDVAQRPKRMLATNAGNVAVIDKSWEEEHEADAIGFSLILGGRAPQEVDLSVIDAVKVAPDDTELWETAVRLMGALAAPMLVFMIEDLLLKCILAAKGHRSTLQARSTHPPSRERVGRLYDASGLPDHPSKCMRYANIAAPLLYRSDWIADRATVLLRER